MNWLRRFFYGRNGADQLTIAQLVLYLVIAILGSILGWKVFTFIGWGVLIWAWFRMLSRNLYAR